MSPFVRKSWFRFGGGDRSQNPFRTELAYSPVDRAFIVVLPCCFKKGIPPKTSFEEKFVDHILEVAYNPVYRNLFFERGASFYVRRLVDFN